MPSLHGSGSRDRILLLACGLFIVAIILFVMLRDRSDDGSPASTGGATGVPSLESGQEESANTPDASRPSRDAIGAKSPPEKQRLSPAEEKELSRRLEVAESSLREIELQNTELLGEIEEPDGKVVLWLISVPTAPQYQKAAEAISRAVGGLPESVTTASLERRTKLLSQYTSFNQPFRVITAFFPRDPPKPGTTSSRKVSFSETDVLRRESVKINDDGTVSFANDPVTNFSGGRGLGERGLARYGHLPRQEPGVEKK